MDGPEVPASREDPPPRETAAALFLLLILAVGVTTLCQLIRPAPFSTSGDGFIEYMPVIRAHTDSMLSGTRLRILWDLGDGWSPWEGVHAGYAYLPHLVSALLSRAIGEPLRLLDVSAGLHFWLSGAFVLLFSPTWIRGAERIAWAALAVVQPAPFLLGLNWHNFLTCYPWLLGAALLLLRMGDEPGERTTMRRLLLIFFSVQFYIGSHPQMYVLGAGFVLALVLADRGWGKGCSDAWAWFVAQLPMALPILYVKALAMRAAPDYMTGRDAPNLLLRDAQTVWTWLHGVLVGNLVPCPDFRLWPADVSTGVGMFFSPALVGVCVLSILRRRWSLVALGAALAVFQGAASFPWLTHLAVGPLAGFRWTWKVCLFAGAFGLIGVPRLLARRPSSTWVRPAVLSIGVLLSLIVCLRGLSFELWPSVIGAYEYGAPGIVRETRRFLNACGAPPGVRVATIGAFHMAKDLPVPYLGLLGNSPILAGAESVNLYEPLEDREAALGHLHLSMPWRVAIPAEDFRARRSEWEAVLRERGVQALVAMEADTLDPDRTTAFTDGRGKITYYQPVAQAVRSSYPWLRRQDGEEVPLRRLPGGDLESAVSPAPGVRLVTRRTLRWERRADGGWVGRFVGPDLRWFLGEAAVVLGTLLLAGIVPLPRPRSA